jgi:hypothetical protein
MRRLARILVLVLATQALLSLSACSAGGLPTAPTGAQAPAGPSLTETVTPSGG